MILHIVIILQENGILTNFMFGAINIKQSVKDANVFIKHN